MIHIVADQKSFSKSSSLNRYRTLLYLKEKHNVSILEPPILDINCVVENDTVIFYFLRPHNHPSVKNIIPYIDKMKMKKAKIIFYIEDIYHVDLIKRLCERYSVFDVIFSIKHQKIMSKFGRKYSIKVWDHTIDLNMFRPYQETKTTDILFYGCKQSKTYPFRKRLYTILKQNPKLQGLRKKFIEFRNYENTSAILMEEDLAKEISRSYLAVATTSKYNFLVKKYLEIPACGTMILGNIPTNYKNLYNEETMCAVNINMTGNEIANKILEILSNKNNLREKTNHLQKSIELHFDRKKSFENLKKILMEHSVNIK